MADDKKITIAHVQKVSEREDNALSNLIGRNQSRMLSAIRGLENKMIQNLRIIETNPNGRIESAKVNLKQTQAIHKEMVKDFEKLYNIPAREIVGDFAQIDRLISQSWTYLNESANFTGVEKSMQASLRKSMANTFKQFGTDAQNRIDDALYSHMVGGGSYASLVRTVTGVLTGHVDVRGRSMAAYAKQYANDATMNYHNQVNIQKADSLGISTFLYVGDIIGSSRKFCRRRAGKIYTRAQINSWNRIQWEGKAGPAMTHRGGYNCRHHWRPIKKEWMNGRDKVDISDWFVGQDANIKRPKFYRKNKKNNVRGWLEYTKAERLLLSDLYNTIVKGGLLNKNQKHVKFWFKGLSAAEREAFIKAFEKQKLDVQPLLKLDKLPKKTVKPTPKPVPKKKAAAKKKAAPKAPEAGKSPSETPEISPSWEDKEDLKRQIDELEKRRKEERLPYSERKILEDQLEELQLEYVKVADVFEYDAMREEVLESMFAMSKEFYEEYIRTSGMGYTYKMVMETLTEGTKHLSYKTLKELQRSGLKIQLRARSNKGSFMPVGKTVNLSIDGNMRTVAHEIGHAIDSRMAAGTKRTFSGQFGYWEKGNAFNVSEETGSKYRDWLNSRLTGRTATAMNGDYEYMYHIGNLINKYEGRDYQDGSFFPEFFSMGTQRYAEAFTSIANGVQSRIINLTTFKSYKEISDKVRRGLANKIEKIVYKDTQEVVKLLSNKIDGETYIDNVFGFLRAGEWKQQRDYYPEYAQWMKEFYREQRKDRPFNLKDVLDKLDEFDKEFYKASMEDAKKILEYMETEEKIFLEHWDGKI